MAWNDNPKVIGINTASNIFEVISYGNNANRCSKAKELADRIYQEIANGEIEVN